MSCPSKRKAFYRRRLFLGFCGAILLLSSMWGCSACGTDLVELCRIPAKVESLLGAEKRLRFGTWEEHGGQAQRVLRLFASGPSVEVMDIRILQEGGDKGPFRILQTLAFPFILDNQREGAFKLNIAFNTTERYVKYQAKLQLRYRRCSASEGSEVLVISLENVLSPAKVAWKCDAGLLSFGRIKHGEAPTRTCRLVNDGGSDVSIKEARFVSLDGAARAVFSLLKPSLPALLKAGDAAGVLFEVRFAPKDPRPTAYKAAWDILDKDGEQLTILRAFGTMNTKKLELIPKYPPCMDDTSCQRIDGRLRCVLDAPSQMKICKVPEGQMPLLIFPLTSKGKISKRSFLIRNTGKTEFIIDRIEWKGTFSFGQDFNIVRPALPLALKGGQEKEVVVEYAPSDDKSDQGTIAVRKWGDETVSAEMRVEAAERGCNLQVQPLRVDFRGPLSKQVTLINKGNEPCEVHRIYLASGKREPYTLLPTPKPNQILVPNGSLSFLVKFSPRDRSQVRDHIKINSSDPDEPVIEVELNATPVGGLPCELVATPSRLHFGLVPVSKSHTASITLANKGYGDCEISAVNVVGTHPARHKAFQLASIAKVPLKIAAGSSMRLNVSYTPPAKRSGYEGQIKIDNNDPRSPTYVVKLIGSSGFVCLDIVPAHLDFGASKFGCATPKVAVEVFHSGAPACKQTIQIKGVKLAHNTNGEFRINAAPTMPKHLTAGQSIRVELSYKAKDLGVDTATLEIGNDVPGQDPIPVPLVGEGVATSDQKDVFKQINHPTADILWMMDLTCSMASHHQAMTSNQALPGLFKWMSQVGVDFHLMVVPIQPTIANTAIGCGRGQTRIITKQTPDGMKVFTDNSRPKVHTGSASSVGLEAAYQALLAPASTGCNQGFFRKSAALSLVFVTEQDDNSSRPIGFYQGFFQSLKGRKWPEMLKITAVGSPASGCRLADGTHIPATKRYWDFSTQMKGQTHSLCNISWKPVMEAVGKLSSQLRSRFFLSRRPDPNTLRVKVNGMPVIQNAQTGWSYSPLENAISFAQSQTPPRGATIEVAFKAICLP